MVLASASAALGESVVHPTSDGQHTAHLAEKGGQTAATVIVSTTCRSRPQRPATVVRISIAPIRSSGDER